MSVQDFVQNIQKINVETIDEIANILEILDARLSGIENGFQ